MKIKGINVKVIPYAKQRYETLGDYWLARGIMEIRITDVKNWIYHFLIALHEMVEYHLCMQHGIKESDITKFDIWWNKQYDLGLVKGEEPGEHPKAPYFKEHAFATKIERMMCEKLGISWKKYNDYLYKECC